MKKAAVESTIEMATGKVARVRSRRVLGGASFDRAECWHLDDGRRFFVKHGAASASARFVGEAAGLRALAEPGVLRVPRWATSGVDASGDRAFIVMEMIDHQSGGDDPWRRLGRLLAEHHRATVGTRFGFTVDNHCGATPQPNPWTRDSVAFWRDHRLGHQLDLARRNGIADPTLLEAAEGLLARLDSLLDPDAVPCLIHGDLWSGNVIVDATPAVIDPAAYYGDREAELAMCQLFGGFPPAFWNAYAEVWPLPREAEERRPIFTLYHLLNHLNLFGIGYRDSCMAILRSVA